MLDGVDFSQWNGDVDFDRVVRAGKRFAYLRATDGAHYVDPKFLTFVDRGFRAGLKLGPYSFARVDLNPEDDVEAFLAATDSVKSKLELATMFDLEVLTKGMSAQQTLDFTCGWADRHIAERACGILLYSYRAFLLSLVKELGGPTSAGAQELAQFPLAIAQYTTKPPDLTGLPWGFWTIHQWAGSDPNGPLGTCDGVKGNVDLDRFNGDDLSWIASS